MDGSPQIVLAKFVVHVDWQKLHYTKILLQPRGQCEDILGRLEYQLGTAVSGTMDAEIVKVGLKLTDIIGRGLKRNPGEGVLLPEIGGVV